MYELFHRVVWLSYIFLLLQDLVVSGRAGVEDFILSFLGPEAVEVALLKQVLPSIHTLRVLRGLRIQPVRTTTLLAPIKVIRMKYCYNSDTSIALLLRILHRHSPTWYIYIVICPRVRCKSNFEQVETEHLYVQLYAYIQGSPAEIKTPTRWNLIGRSVTAPPHVIAQQYSPTTFVSLRFH